MKQSTRRIGVVSLIVGALAFIAISERHQPATNSEMGAANIDQTQANQPTRGEPPDTTDLDRDANGQDRNDLKAGEPETQESESEPKPDLAWLREQTVSEVLVAYSLMFRHLGLTEAEQNALTDFLVEVGMSETTMPNYRPEPIPEEDRQAGIAAIIGEAKLAQLLILERNKNEYRETGRTAMHLQTNEAPLTDVQQDQLLDILIRVRARVSDAANPNEQRATVEVIESRMTMMDEYERLVLELAPSVLTSRQMELVFARYQRFSNRRAQMLELQKKTRANEDEEDDFPLVYPARH